MNLQAKPQLTLSVFPRYLKANKGAKKRILDEYCANTGYHRKHAIRKLKEYKLTHRIWWKKTGKYTGRREKVYDIRVKAALATLCNAYDRICAERIHPNIEEIAQKLSACGVLRLDPITEAKVIHNLVGKAETAIEKSERARIQEDTRHY